jgi:hypothetical protein
MGTRQGKGCHLSVTCPRLSYFLLSALIWSPEPSSEIVLTHLITIPGPLVRPHWYLSHAGPLSPSQTSAVLIFALPVPSVLGGSGPQEVPRSPYKCISVGKCMPRLLLCPQCTQCHTAGHRVHAHTVSDHLGSPATPVLSLSSRPWAPVIASNSHRSWMPGTPGAEVTPRQSDGWVSCSEADSCASAGFRQAVSP